MRVNAIQTFVKTVLGGDGKIFLEQLIQRAAEKPAAMQMPFAARRDQLAHREQLEHFEPRHGRFAIGQALLPERTQTQFIPKSAAQPASTEGTRMLQRQFGEFDLQAIENIRWHGAVFGEETDLFGALIGFVDHVKAFAPGRLLRVIDLAQIEDGALDRASGAQTAVFNDAPVAMFLAIFLAGVVAQKHSLRGSLSPGRSGLEGGRSPLAES